MKPAFSLRGFSIGKMTSAIVRFRLGAVLADRLAVDGQRVLVDELALHQLVDDGGHAAGPMEFLAEILAGGLHVDQQRHLVSDLLPVLD